MPKSFIQEIRMDDEHTPTDDEIHFVTRSLFFEDDSVPTCSIPQASGATNSLPNLPMVLYQDPGNFLSKLYKTLKF